MTKAKEGWHFGVERYTKALVERLDEYFRDSASPRREDERALVIGIYGQWGCGKTTWLEAIEQRSQRELGAPRKLGELTSMTVPVMFNAWQYEREPHLIVPLLKTAEVAVRRALSGAPEGDDDAYWAWVRERAVMLWDVAIALVAGLRGELGFDLAGMNTRVGVDASKSMDSWAEHRAERAAKGRPSPSPMDAYESLYFDLHRYIQALTGRGERPEALNWLTEQEREIQGALRAAESLQPDDMGVLGIFRRRRARKQLARELEKPALAIGESNFRLNLLFLIDDLDRCLPEKAVEMLESIKLFLEVRGCAFVLAVDDEIIGRGIQHRYRDYLFESKARSEHAAEADKGPITGAEYLEKIIHLPIRVPTLEVGEARAFLQQTWPELFRARGTQPLDFGGEPADNEGVRWNEALLDLFAHAVPPIPRKLVRAAELFAMLDGMAETMVSEQRFGQSRYERELLARLVILQLHAPEIYREGSTRRGVGFLDDLVWIKKQEEPNKEEPAEAGTDLVLRERADRRAAMDQLVRDARTSRAAFDPLLIVDTSESYDWRERVACHYRLVASDTAIDFAIRGQVSDAAVAPKNLQRFLDLVLTDSREWSRALAEEPGLDGRILDTKSERALLARLHTETEHRKITAEWLDQFGVHLQPSALAQLYREVGLLDAVQTNPSMLARVISFICRAANPPHVPRPTKSEVKLTSLLTPPQTLELGDATFEHSYLVGLDVTGARIPEGPKPWREADLRGAKGFESADTSLALVNLAAAPLQPSLGFGLGGFRSVCDLGGGRVAAAGEDGVLRIWNVAAPDAEPMQLRGHEGRVWSVCRLPEGRLASAGRDSKIRVWSLASPEHPIVLEGHEGWVLSLCEVIQGRLASAGADKTVRVWNLEDQLAEPLVLRGHGDRVWSVCQLDADRLVSASDDGTVRIWSLAAPSEPLVIPFKPAKVRSVCRLDDDQLAFACNEGNEGVVRVWSVKKGMELGVFRGHEGKVWSVCSLDAGQLASAGEDATLRLWQWDPIESEPRQVVRKHSGRVWSVCRLDEGRLASVGQDGTLRVQKLDGSGQIRRLRGHTGRVLGVHAFADKVASAGEDGTVRLWISGLPGRVLRRHAGRVWSVCWLDSNRLVSAGDDRVLRVWNLNAPEPEIDCQVLRGHTSQVLSVCRLDDRHLASASDDGTLRVWNVDAPETACRVLRGHEGRVWSVCRLDDTRIASAGADGLVRVWALDSGADPIELGGHSGQVFSVCPLDDGHLASTGDDGSIRVWSWRSPTAEARVFRGHSGRVWSVCSLDERRIVSAGEDGSIRVWNMGEPEAEPRVLRGHAGTVLSVCPLDHDRFASTGSDGTIRVWSKDKPEWVALTLEDDITVAFQATAISWPISITQPTRRWQTKLIDGIHLPADAELHQLAAFTTRDAARATDLAAPRFRVPIHEFANDHARLWRFRDHDRRTLELAWPDDQREREQMQRWVFGSALGPA